MRSADSQRQYWFWKSKYKDVVLFIKIGTFYELYEDDAQIGVDVLNFKMTMWALLAAVIAANYCLRLVPLDFISKCLVRKYSTKPAFPGKGLLAQLVRAHP